MKRVAATLLAFVLATVPLAAQSFSPTGLTLNVDPSESGRAWQDTTMMTPAGDGELVGALDDAGDALDYAFIVPHVLYRPTFRATGMNGIGALEYPGGTSRGVLTVRDDANTTNPNSSDFLSSSAYTYYVALTCEGGFSSLATPWDAPGILALANTLLGFTCVNDGGQLKLVAFHSDGSGAPEYHQVSVNVDAATNYVARVRFDGSAIYLSLNGGAESSVAAGNLLTPATPVYIGGMFNDRTHDGMLGQYLFYNVNQTGSAQTDTTAYMVNKWVGGAAAPDHSFFTFSLMARLFALPRGRS